MIPETFVAKIKWSRISGESLKEYRKEKKITQTALAKSIGISRQTLAEIEFGKKTDTLDYLMFKNICDKMGIAEDELFLHISKKILKNT